MELPRHLPDVAERAVQLAKVGYRHRRSLCTVAEYIPSKAVDRVLKIKTIVDIPKDIRLAKHVITGKTHGEPMQRSERIHAGCKLGLKYGALAAASELEVAATILTAAEIAVAFHHGVMRIKNK